LLGNRKGLAEQTEKSSRFYEQSIQVEGKEESHGKVTARPQDGKVDEGSFWGQERSAITEKVLKAARKEFLLFQGEEEGWGGLKNKMTSL